jgi:hypothetical protein
MNDAWSCSMNELITRRQALYDEENQIWQLYWKAFELDLRVKEIRKEQRELQEAIMVRLAAVK